MNRPAAVVTGAAGGIGAAVVERFKEEGWFVLGMDICPRDKTHCRSDLYIEVDLGDSTSLEAACASAVAATEGLDALVNNAAVQVAKEFESLTEEDWDTTLAVNLKAPFLCTRYFLSHLKKRKGAVVNVSSVHSVATTAKMLPYAVSKGGLSAMTRAMALDLAPYGIRVNAVAPGAVKTDMLLAGFSRGHVSGTAEQALEEFESRQVLGRVAAPEEIAETVWFLANAKQSSFITGAVLFVDGGATVKLFGE